MGLKPGVIDLNGKTPEELNQLKKDIDGELVRRQNRDLLDSRMDTWLAQHREILGDEAETERLSWDGETLTFKALPADEQPDVPALSEWEPGLAVKAGEEYVYDDRTYAVIQDHTTQDGWEPPSVPALFEVVK